MRIKLWGVRGSLPSPLTDSQIRNKITAALSGAHDVDLTDPEAIRNYVDSLPLYIRGTVGGNTSCIEIDTGDGLIILDAGSGLRRLGDELMKTEFGKGKGKAHVFLSHFHWDHICGFPFFKPAFVPGNHITFYSGHKNARRFLETQQTAPSLFPVDLDYMASTKEFVYMPEGAEIKIGSTTIKNKLAHHPGGSYIYRVEDGYNSMVYATDAEYEHLDGPHLQPYLDFYRDADLLIFDSQYSLGDSLDNKADWGHSSAIIGVDVASAAGVKRLVTFHHEPGSIDEDVLNMVSTTREYAFVQADLNGGIVEVLVGYEGLEIELAPSRMISVSAPQNRATSDL